MRRNTPVVWCWSMGGLLLSASLMAAGCNNLKQAAGCSQLCSAVVNCRSNIVGRIADLSGVTHECDFAAAEEDVVNACVAACDNAQDGIAAASVTVVSNCTKCVGEQLASTASVQCTDSTTDLDNAVAGCSDCNAAFDAFREDWETRFDVDSFAIEDSLGRNCITDIIYTK